CFSWMILSIPAAFNSWFIRGNTTDGSREPHSNALRYASSTPLQALTSPSTSLLSHTNPRAGEGCASRLNASTCCQTSGGSSCQTFTISSFGQDHVIKL